MTRRLVVFPAWRANPYLNILTLASSARGVSIHRPTKIRRFLAETLRVRRGDAIHVHWTRPVSQTAKTRREAVRRLRLFRLAISVAKWRGVRVLWTVHNAVSHETTHLDLDIDVNRFLAAKADDILVLSPSTPAAVSRYVELPSDKVTVLPHSSYWGVYPNDLSREEARERLSIANEVPVVGFVGQMRQYKGLPTLVEAMERVWSTRPDAVLLLAGNADAETRAFLEGFAGPRLRVVDGFVPDEDLQLYFTASDVLVFPYSRVLNSGSMFLSATFSRSCILPSVTPLREDFGDQEWVSLYDPENAVTSLSSAIVTALDREASEQESAESAARDFARSHLPWDMALAYDELLQRPS